MNTVDQAFWQLFHAVQAKMSDPAIIDALPAGADPSQSIALELSGPVHALGVLRREAERRAISCPELIARLSEERKAELPQWWLVVAASRGVGRLDGDGGAQR